MVVLCPTGAATIGVRGYTYHTYLNIFISTLNRDQL